jgi:hypothetical protein
MAAVVEADGLREAVRGVPFAQKISPGSRG